MALAPVVLWFRRDLRLQDQPALSAAAATGAAVIPVYIHAPEEEGAGRAGAASRWWLHHSLHALRAALSQRGLDLQVFRGRSADVLRRIVAETKAQAVYWNLLYEPALVERDTTIKQVLRDSGLGVHSSNGALLSEPWQLSNQTGAAYRVFTPYWRRLLAELQHHQPLQTPRLEPSRIAISGTVSIDDLRLLPRIPWADGLASAWRPGESGALARLERFLDQVDQYGWRRDRPDLDGTSSLSPHLHFGEISPRQIVAALFARCGALDVSAAEPFLRELGWREFAHYVLWHFPQTIHANFQPRYDDLSWIEPNQARLQAWQRGRTGIPIIDAGMRQLWQTGWMHNRVRMLVASFLCKNLGYHWRHGAAWFHDTLVDADLAANTLGWQWSAGTGVDAAPYFRIFNPVTQGQRFDPDGAYVRRFVAELTPVAPARIHQPQAVARASSASGYPGPIIDLAESRAAALARFAALRAR